jgi:uncharacterized membrane protein
MSLVKDLLQGKWLGHPLHPALVHLPTGLWPAALLLDIGSYIFPEEPARAMAVASYWCIAVGIIAALGAAPAGLADWWDIKPERPAHRIGLIHMSLNVAVLVIFVVSLILRSLQGRATAPVPMIDLVLSIIANAILMVSGYLGGRMVYEYGTGVARLSKKKWRRLAEAGGANVPEE